MRTRTHLHWDPRQDEEAWAKETKGLGSRTHATTWDLHKINSNVHFFSPKSRPEEVIYDTENSRNVWMSLEHVLPGKQEYSSHRCETDTKWVKAQVSKILTITHTLGVKHSGGQAWGDGGLRMRIYRRRSGWETANPDTAGDVLSEISDFPAVALSSINP